jgi:pimeloyl-ACP methyl ester carboxylesterase
MHADFETLRISGRALRYVCRGEGSPSIVIDQGSGLSIEAGFLGPVLAGWARVFRQLEKATRVLMHDRAGLGWSSEPSAPRTSAEMVSDLRRVLREARVAPPYVLVGHSIGGFNVRLFASEHPREVAGMVLVEASHPEQWRRFAKVLPPQSLRESAILQRLRGRLDPDLTPERIDFTMSAEQVRAARPLGDTPLVVLTRSPKRMFPSGLPADVAEPMERIWGELQKDLLGLSRRSRQIVATHGGHNLQLDEPRLVGDAILRLLREVKATAARLQ